MQSKNLLQREIDSLQTGMEITEFCLKDLHPPIDLAVYFENVVAADQTKETLLNDAQRYKNIILSNARMRSLESVAKAEGYCIERKYKAQGKAKNYLLRFSGYKAGGKLTKNTLLLKTAETTLKGKKIYLLDPSSGIDEQLIYIENYVMDGKKQ